MPVCLLQAQDKFLMVDVKVQAPVLIVPTSQEATQGLMVDLGSFSIQNTLLAPADNVGVDAYGFTLSSFKISRYFFLIRNVYTYMYNVFVFMP